MTSRHKYAGAERLLLDVEQTRLVVSKACDPKRKSQFGQFFTPVAIARHMAGLFDGETCDGQCALLDAGAGIGTLSVAFLDRWASGGFDFESVHVDAFEVDESLHPHLARTFEPYLRRLNAMPAIRKNDFIHAAVDSLCGGLFAETLPKYTHAILNPPYKKIRSDSAHRFALRKAGIETVNLYSAFVALSLSLLADHGQLVAIIPRSFCNGPYYRPFREYILKRAAIRHVHLFASRSKAFKDDDVLQENVIIMLERAGRQGAVTVATSADDSFSDLETNEYPFDQIVSPRDRERFIHIPTTPGIGAIGRLAAVRHSLKDISLNVSTGPVVDFRVREYLRHMPDAGTVPLLYPVHFSGSEMTWPKPDSKKPNAIQSNCNTRKWLYPNGFYCVVRRFSSKEEKRRIAASVVRPDVLGDSELLGFENHLNLFHEERHGLSEALACGLATFLNSTAVDEYFRRFSGHTQVNATDLRRMKYPCRALLVALGKWFIHLNAEPSQSMLDKHLEEIAT